MNKDDMDNSSMKKKEDCPSKDKGLVDIVFKDEEMLDGEFIKIEADESEGNEAVNDFNRAIYRKMLGAIEKKIRFERRVRSIAFALMWFTIGSLACSIALDAHPFQSVIKVAEFLNGRYIYLTQGDAERGDVITDKFDIYQVGYMTKDYIFMRDEDLTGIYRMEYYKDSMNYVFINQTSKTEYTYIFLSDEGDYETILLDNIEYFYSYDSKKGLSNAYFINGDTGIHICGTVDKEEILRIAIEIY